MVSIVMPVYNQSQFIREAIDSILAQTYKDFELIIVNDGSTDDTEDIILSYKDPRIKYIKKDNGGTGSALNEGFAITKGGHETWWASDNKMYPDCLKELHQYLVNNPDVDYVYSAIHYAKMLPDGKTIEWQKHISEILNQDWDKEKFYLNYFLGCCWAWKRSLRLKCGDGKFQLEPCEDYDMALRMVESGGKFAFLDKVLGWYRQHRENISHTLESHHWYKEVTRRAADRRKGRKEPVRINTGKMKIAIVNLEFDCAGVGWNLKEAINKYTNHTARHITKTLFEFAPHTDYVIDFNKLDEFKKELEWADVLHFNQWIWRHNPLKNKPFEWSPFNDVPLLDFDHYFKTRRVFYHYHSGEILAEPSYWIRECKRVGARIFACDPPSEIVIPESRWMPNVLDIYKFCVSALKDGESMATYSAHGEGDDRKNVRLYGRFMEQLKRCGFNIPYEDIWGHEKEKSYELRKNKHVALESMTEGYIGMVGWEALAMGHAVIARLGDYTRKRYRDLGEGEPPPIQHAESPQIMTHILRDMFNARPAFKRIMADSRAWMEKYYNPRRIVNMYIDEYKKD